MTKVELFEFIRKEYFNHHKSIRQIAKEQHVHRRQVRRAIENAVPPARKIACRKGTVLTLWVKQTIDGWLQEDLQAPRKQRHTAQRIYQRLKAEAGFSGSAGTIAQYVCKQRKILGLSAQAFIPQIHFPGEEAEAEKIVIFKRGHCIAQHNRRFEQGRVSATLDHYLPLLKHKPGALAGSVALNQSRQHHHWPVVYDQYWQNLKAHDGDSEGNRKMVDWLWWARDFELPEACALLEEALKLGCYSLESIQCLKRQRQETREPSTQLSLDLLGDLVRYERPMSTINHYDSLLTAKTGEPL